MSETHLPPGTKSCGDCEAPVPVDGPKHTGAGDCRAAQRKEIRRLRDDNDRMRGKIDECGKMHGALKLESAGDGAFIWEPATFAAPDGRAPAYTFDAPARVQVLREDPLVASYRAHFESGNCTCRFVGAFDQLRGRPCVKHG